MAEPAGALAVRIGADVSDLIAGFTKAEKQTQLFEKSITRVGGAVAAAAAALFAIAKTTADTADELGKLSQKVGISVESLSALKYAASLSDLSLEQLGTGLKKLSVNMQQAQSGTNETSATFKALGISVTNANGTLRSSDEVLGDVAEAFSQMKDGAGKTAIAMTLFGKAGADMIPLLNQGKQGLREAADEAQRFGLIVSKDAAKQAEEFNDNLTKLEKIAEGWKNQIGNVLIPPLVEFQKQLLEGIRITGGFWKALITLGTINPFKSLEGNLATLRKELDDLEANKAKRSGRAGFDPKPYDDKIAEVKKQIEFLEFMKKEEEKKTNPPPDEGKDGKPKKDAPFIPDPKEVERRAQEVRDVMHKVQEDNDARELKQIQFQIQQREDAEKKAAEQAIELQDMLAAQDVERGKQELEGRKYRQDQLAKMQEDFSSFQEKQEEEDYARRIVRVYDFTDAELEAVGGRHAVLEKMEGDHIEKLARIRGAGDVRVFKMINAMRDGDIANATGYFTELTAGLAQHSRKWFELNKAAGIANAIIHAYEGISLSLSKYPMPWAAAAAAAHAALAFAQVQAIRATTFEGGGAGSAPSLAGSSPATPVTPVGGGDSGGSTARQSTIINLHGETYGREQVRDLIGRLNEEGRDGGRIVLVERLPA